MRRAPPRKGGVSRKEGSIVEVSSVQMAAGMLPDGVTTVMLRNVPNRYTCEELLAEIMNAGYDHTPFDFFYLPIDFTTKRNRGYGFINFHSSKDAEEFSLAFHHRRLDRYPTSKILEVAPAKTQGYEANMSKYFKKSGCTRVKNDYFKPMLFTQASELTD